MNVYVYMHLRIFPSLQEALVSTLSPSIIDNHYSDFCHQKIVLPILKHHISRVTEYLLLWVWLLLLIVMSMRFIHATCSSSSISVILH